MNFRVRTPALLYFTFGFTNIKLQSIISQCSLTMFENPRGLTKSKYSVSWIMNSDFKSLVYVLYKSYNTDTWWIWLINRISRKDIPKSKKIFFSNMGKRQTVPHFLISVLVPILGKIWNDQFFETQIPRVVTDSTKKNSLRCQVSSCFSPPTRTPGTLLFPEISQTCYLLQIRIANW